MRRVIGERMHGADDVVVERSGVKGGRPGVERIGIGIGHAPSLASTMSLTGFYLKLMITGRSRELVPGTRSKRKEEVPPNYTDSVEEAGHLIR